MVTLMREVANNNSLMNPSGQSQIVWGQQPHTTVTQESPSRSDGNLRGSNVRRIMGFFQIICGSIGFALGVAAICVPVSYYFDSIDYVGWGIWNGVYGTFTGFLGVYSRRKKGMVVAYMVTSIVAALLSASCCIYAGFGASEATWYHSYIDKSTNLGANLAIYILMCIVFFIEMVISIVGASFTCGAVCTTKNRSQQIVYYYAHSAQTHQYVPAPPYTLVPAQQYNAPQNTQSFQSTTPNAYGSNEPSKN